jgi:hypothetical protein
MLQWYSISWNLNFNYRWPHCEYTLIDVVAIKTLTHFFDSIRIERQASPSIAKVLHRLCIVKGGREKVLGYFLILLLSFVHVLAS